VRRWESGSEGVVAIEVRLAPGPRLESRSSDREDGQEPKRR
jgi:hypothetical protein